MLDPNDLAGEVAVHEAPLDGISNHLIVTIAGLELAHLLGSLVVHLVTLQRSSLSLEHLENIVNALVSLAVLGCHLRVALQQLDSRIVLAKHSLNDGRILIWLAFLTLAKLSGHRGELQNEVVCQALSRTRLDARELILGLAFLFCSQRHGFCVCVCGTILYSEKKYRIDI